MSLPSVRSFTFLGALLFGTISPARAHSQQHSIGDSVPIARTTPLVGQTTVTTDSSLSKPVMGPRFEPVGVTRLAVMPWPAGVQEGDAAGMNAGSNVAMMGVGVAGIVVGSIVGGDSGTMIAVGGAVIGLIGLFRYLR